VASTKYAGFHAPGRGLAGLECSSTPASFRLFYQRFRDRAGSHAGVALRADAIHGALLSSAFDVAEAGAVRRRPSISVDGTPVVYSLKVPAPAGPPVFRFLCEPGGLGITVREQIDLSRQTLRALTNLLGWPVAQEIVDRALARIIPEDPATVSDWRGGLWLGAEFQPDAAELRLYANLRHGDAIARWQRVGDLLATFGDERLIPVLRAWQHSAGRVAIPVGVALVLTGNDVPVFRLYLGVEQPGMEAVRAARGEQYLACDAPLADFCDAFTEAYGLFGRQSMTLGYDFARDNGGLFFPETARFKMDVSFGHIGCGAEPPPALFIGEQIERVFPGSSAHWFAFRDDLEVCFGGSDIEYVSLAARGQDAGGSSLSEITVYVRPHVDSIAAA
jgi:hypothetical protein